MKIAGIDPGTTIAGYALIDYDRVSKRIRVLDLGAWTLAGADRVARLGDLWVRAEAWLDASAPRVLALELAHVGPHPGASLAISEARGVVLAAAYAHDVKVCQYRPSTAKKAITGRGNASKPQVRTALVARFGLNPEAPLDASDALALAVTHAPHELAPRAWARA